MKIISRLSLVAVLGLALLGVSTAGASSVHPYSGSYLGSTIHDNTVRVTYRDGAIHDLKIDGKVLVAKASVRNLKFHVTLPSGVYVEGSWTASDLYTLNGHYTVPINGPLHEVVHFSAQAFSH